MGSNLRALVRWATLSAAALSIFTSSTTSFASENRTLAALVTVPAPAFVLTVPFDLISNDPGLAPVATAGSALAPPFDFAAEADNCVVCRVDDAPFLLFSL